MIEKYLQLGVCYRWAKPQDRNVNHNGKIVNSILATPPLTYIGLGKISAPKLRVKHVRDIGLQMNMDIQYQWLDYALGQTARVPIGPYDVLTGFMSGCIIARWTDRGVNYVGHVGTIDSSQSTNKLVKRTFAFAMPKGTTGFNPANAWEFDEISDISKEFSPKKLPYILALVTTGGEFYSVLMFFEGSNRWYCGGSKRVEAISHDDLKLLMLRVD